MNLNTSARYSSGIVVVGLDDAAIVDERLELLGAGPAVHAPPLVSRSSIVVITVADRGVADH